MRGLKIFSSLIIGTFIAISGYCQDFVTDDSLPRVNFQELLDSAKMVFTPPAGYIETEPVYNKQMNYEKAYKHPTERFEIRYAIRRHEFNFFQQMFEMTALNISG
jgi:hypothetical protein